MQKGSIMFDTVRVELKGSHVVCLTILPLLPLHLPFSNRNNGQECAAFNLGDWKKKTPHFLIGNSNMIPGIHQMIECNCCDWK